MIQLNDNLFSKDIWSLTKELFPICRSLTGSGVVKTLNILNRELNDQLKVSSVATGTKVFDWEVPQEWSINEAYIITPDGRKICDFEENNLHILGYSEGIEAEVSLEDLLPHLYSLPDFPDWIPYITSYYKKRWGFCIKDSVKKNLQKGTYKVKIDAQLFDGNLRYGEIVIPGRSKDEIFFSTYVCHPSMGNNETSGPVVLTHILKNILSLNGNHHYTYRAVFIPETIGSITYLSQNLDQLKNIKAGFNLTCVGDNNEFSYLPSRNGNTLADKSALYVLKNNTKHFKTYSFLDRGSDERQYCSPGIDLPLCSVMRSKYGEYNEYHTSADDLNFISEEGLNGTVNLYLKIIECLENNLVVQSKVYCEPQLGKRGLYPTLSSKETYSTTRNMMNVLAYADGRTTLEISEKINVPQKEVFRIAKLLADNGLIELNSPN